MAHRQRAEVFPLPPSHESRLPSSCVFPPSFKLQFPRSCTIIRHQAVPHNYTFSTLKRSHTPLLQNSIYLVFPWFLTTGASYLLPACWSFSPLSPPEPSRSSSPSNARPT